MRSDPAETCALSVYGLDWGGELCHGAAGAERLKNDGGWVPKPSSPPDKKKVSLRHREAPQLDVWSLRGTVCSRGDGEILPWDLGGKLNLSTRHASFQTSRAPTCSGCNVFSSLPYGIPQFVEPGPLPRQKCSLCSRRPRAENAVR